MVEQLQGRQSVPGTRYLVLSPGYILNMLYLALVAVTLPWLLYQRFRHGKYREGFAAKFFGNIPPRTSTRPCLWLHAVSVGEVNLLEPVLARWRRMHPDWDCVISTTTQTGYALAKRKYAGQSVIYCPLDFTWSVRRAVARIRPTLLVLTELEIWPNLIAAAREQGVKVAIINGRLSKRSFQGYSRLRWFISTVLRSIDLIAAQNEEYAERFFALGARGEAVAITGSIKFDGARTRRDAPEVQRLQALAGIADGDVVFLAGSTQEPEESIALSVFIRLVEEFPKLKLVLVPRHPERFEDVASLLESSGLPWARRSKLPPVPCPPSPVPPRILLVDAVGELGHWWGAAQIGFVGGSLTRRGGQNMIEPAAYGAAVSFGPNTWNFRDIVGQLLGREAAVVVRNRQELEAFVRRCLTDTAYVAQLGQRAQELVVQQQGAADRTVRLLEDLIASSSVRAAA
jgi:3-deoxy-D-manno-octulosonic-acid transferase